MLPVPFSGSLVAIFPAPFPGRAVILERIPTGVERDVRAQGQAGLHLGESGLHVQLFVADCRSG
jgi:hypothetical protein